MDGGSNLFFFDGHRVPWHSEYTRYTYGAHIEYIDPEGACGISLLRPSPECVVFHCCAPVAQTVHRVHHVRAAALQDYAAGEGYT